MNGRYGLAKTSLERLAIAVTRANEVWKTRHPDHFKEGLLPGQGFYEEQLIKILERERFEIRVDEIHELMQELGKRELALVFKKTESRREAERLMSGD